MRPKSNICLVGGGGGNLGGNFGTGVRASFF